MVKKQLLEDEESGDQVDIAEDDILDATLQAFKTKDQTTIPQLFETFGMAWIDSG